GYNLTMPAAHWAGRRALGRGVMAARETLDLVVQVRILAPQPWPLRSGFFCCAQKSGAVAPPPLLLPPARPFIDTAVQRFVSSAATHGLGRTTTSLGRSLTVSTTTSDV